MTPACCPGRTALVLSGGGARGAYEAGVVRFVREALPQALGFQPRLDVICGTSIGAVNACFLASTADEPDLQGTRLADVWLSLRLEDVFHWSALRLTGIPAYVWRQARAVRLRHVSWRLSDFLYPEALARVVNRRVDWDRLHLNVRTGLVDALTVTATDLGTGRSVVFVETARAVPAWSRSPLVEVRPGEIGPEHALASGAIPLFFRPVRIDGGWFTDGGVRQNTPLAPAIRLGADRMLVVGLRAERKVQLPREESPEPPTTAAQLGKILNALMLDRTDYDLDRMRRLNAVIDEGERVFGPGFGERLSSVADGDPALSFRRVRDVVIRPSVDLSIVAREHAERRIRHVRRGTFAARLLRRAAADAAAESDGAADLASYLLFDREYAADLMALGYQDAAARRDDLVAFFRAPAEAGSLSPAGGGPVGGDALRSG